MEVGYFAFVFLYLPLDTVKKQVLHSSPSLVEQRCWGCCSRRRLSTAHAWLTTHAWIPSLVMPLLHPSQCKGVAEKRQQMLLLGFILPCLYTGQLADRGCENLWQVKMSCLLSGFVLEKVRLFWYIKEVTGFGE